MKSTNASSKNGARQSTGSNSSANTKSNFILKTSSLAPNTSAKSPKNSLTKKALPVKQQDQSTGDLVSNASAQVISINSKLSSLSPSNNYVPASHANKRFKSNASPDVNLSEDEESTEEEEPIVVDLPTAEIQTAASQADTDGYTIAGAKEDRPKNKRLPAIRVRIAQPETAKFNNNSIKEKAEELQRCFPNHDLSKIKFVEFDKRDPCTLLIATDDATTHQLISTMSNWPSNAFGNGVKSRNRNTATARTQQQTYTFSLSRVPTSIDVQSDDIAAEFKKLGFSKVVRTINSTTNTASQFLRLYTDNKDVYSRHVYQQKPVTLYWTNFYAKPDTKPLQCFKCQGLGHVVFDCPSNEPKCLKCGLNHELKNCTDKTDKVHCVNCTSDEHVSCSRKCPAIRAHIKVVEEKKAEKSSAQQQKQQQLKQKEGPHKTPRQKTANQQQQPAANNNNQKLWSKVHEQAQTIEQSTPPEAQPDRADLDQKIEDLKDIVLQLLEIIKGLVPADKFNAIIAKNKQSFATPKTMTPC